MRLTNPIYNCGINAAVFDLCKKYPLEGCKCVLATAAGRQKREDMYADDTLHAFRDNTSAKRQETTALCFRWFKKPLLVHSTANDVAKAHLKLGDEPKVLLHVCGQYQLDDRCAHDVLVLHGHVACIVVGWIGHLEVKCCCDVVCLVWAGVIVRDGKRVPDLDQKVIVDALMVIVVANRCTIGSGTAEKCISLDAAQGS